METNEELNRWAHSLLGLCWHEPKQKSVDVGLMWVPCIHCTDLMKVDLDGIYNPEYTESLDLAAKVEAKAIEMVGEDVYLNHLIYALSALKTPSERRGVSETEFMRLMVTAPALTRVQAAKRAVEGK